jgi:sterol 14-demethylase
MGLRIELDEVLCQGHGVCEGEAPEVFELSKKGVLTILQPTPDESLRSQVEAAVKYCPTHALLLHADDSVAGPEKES